MQVNTFKLVNYSATSFNLSWGSTYTYTDVCTYLLQSSEHKEIISNLARFVDSITVPLAKASILWLIGEYSDRVPKIAPDVLRKMAKSFINEVETGIHSANGKLQ